MSSDFEPPTDPAYRPVAPSTAPTAPAAPTPALSANATLLVPLLVGGVVAVAVGVYGRLHEPSHIAVSLAGFSGPLTVKVWLTTGVLLFALVQLGSALMMYGKIPGVAAPSWTGTLHRWLGRSAFLLAVPVAIHCLYAVGLQFDEPRVIVHSLLGCFFFGAFTAKMLVLSKKGTPAWALPLLGGLVFTALVGLWLSASLWFFATQGVKF